MELEEGGFGFGGGPYTSSGSNDVPVEAQDQAPESAPADPTVLTDLQSGSLSRVFAALKQQASDEQQDFTPTLKSLQDLVLRLHDAGLMQTGVENADLDKLRANNLIRRGASSEDAHVSYSFLQVGQARFLLRVHPENIVDCLIDNINRPLELPQYLDSNDFWYIGGNQAKPRFFQYDLSQEEGRLGLVNAVLHAAAQTEAMQELANFNVAPRSQTPLAKKLIQPSK